MYGVFCSILDLKLSTVVCYGLISQPNIFLMLVKALVSLRIFLALFLMNQVDFLVLLYIFVINYTFLLVCNVPGT